MNPGTRLSPPRPIVTASAILAACALVAACRPSPPPVPQELTLDIEVGRIVFNWQPVAGASSYQPLRCPYPDDGKAPDCAQQALDACQPAGPPLAGTTYTEVPPKGEIFCWRVRACAAADGTACSPPSVGRPGAHKPPYKIQVKTAGPARVQAGATVTLTAEADTPGTVTGFRWIQMGEPKDLVLQGAESDTVTWVAPRVTTPTAYTLKVMASDDYKLNAFAARKVVVVPEGMPLDEPAAGKSLREVLRLNQPGAGRFSSPPPR